MSRRPHHHHESSGMAGILGPELRKAPPKDFHRENINMMHQREQEVQKKLETESQQAAQPQGQWKMKRFASVESKLGINGGNSMTQEQQPYGQSPAQEPTRKMTKGEAMKLRMAQGGQKQPGPIPMENVQAQRAALRESTNKPLPPRAPARVSNAARKPPMQPAQMEESIYTIKGDQPMVVKYTPDMMKAPEPAPMAPPKRGANRMSSQRLPGVPRASSVQNRAAQNAGRQILSSQGSQKQVNGTPKQAVPKASEVNQLKGREQKNFVKGNINKAVFELKPENQSAQGASGIAANKNYGKVPSYLNKYKNQKEDKLKQAAYDEEMSKHPPGTRLMPEDERVETLVDLREAKAETNRQLERLPVVAHSAKMDRHKKELDEKLERLDKAIETFSKPTVYVAM